MANHTITIPDDLWQMYKGSPMAMRHVLYLYAYEQKEQGGRPLIVSNNPQTIDLGTTFTLEHGRRCSNWKECATSMNPGDSALVRTNEAGNKVYLCDSCADEFHKEYAKSKVI